jgi:hypothetical protein
MVRKRLKSSHAVAVPPGSMAATAGKPGPYGVRPRARVKTPRQLAAIAMEALGVPGALAAHERQSLGSARSEDGIMAPPFSDRERFLNR